VANDAAADTFSELSRPLIGMLTIRSQRSRTKRDKPAPSAPNTKQMPSAALLSSTGGDPVLKVVSKSGESRTT